MRSKRSLLPRVVAHADWSANAGKRWMAVATRSKAGTYTIDHPNLVGDPRSLLDRLRQIAGEDESVFLGFDFPIGIPLKYADKAGVEDFLNLLPRLGKGIWRDFFSVAESPEEINLYRPFYPRRPGGKKQVHLVSALDMRHINDLRRKCDLARANRRAASPLFWTLGAQQVGKAAISGWKDVLVPAARDEDPNIAIWPFFGKLADLFEPGRLVVGETYPAEVYTHLAITFSSPRPGKKSGKREQAERASNAGPVFSWASQAGVNLSTELSSAIQNGFGARPGGEDPFDATIGLLGMLNVIIGDQAPGEPEEEIRRVEGWILGQPYD